MEINESTKKILIFNERKLNKSTSWLLFLFLGWHYGNINQTTTQIIYYLTLGGLGFWTLVVFLTLNDNIDDYNSRLAKEIGLSDDDMLILGIKPIKSEVVVNPKKSNSSNRGIWKFYLAVIVIISLFFALKSFFYKEQYSPIYIKENGESIVENKGESIAYENDTIAYLDLSEKFHTINEFNKKYNSFKINKGLNLKTTYDSLYVVDSKNRNITSLFVGNNDINQKIEKSKDSIHKIENVIENYYKSLSISNDDKFIKKSNETFINVDYYNGNKSLSKYEYHIDTEYKYNNGKLSQCKILIYSRDKILFDNKLKHKEYSVNKIQSDGIYYKVIEIIVTNKNINVIRGFLTNDDYNSENPFPYMNDDKKDNFLKGLDYFIKENI